MNSRLFVSMASMALVGLASFVYAPAPAIAAGNKLSLFDKLQSQPVAEITLFTDLNSLVDNKRTDDYLPAVFEHEGQHWDISVRVRGRYRRRVCDFPPLRLQFDKQMLKAGGLQGYNSFKLVTHCSDEMESKELVLREQLAYELYAQLSADHFRTQLVRITYRDTESALRLVRYGILIEDTDEMAARAGGEECDECFAQPFDRFSPGNMEQVALFQYMIGNADWSARSLRNIKIVRNEQNGLLEAVPYDFDFAILIDAPYLRLNADWGQTAENPRVFIWELDAAPRIGAAIDHFLSRKQALLDRVDAYEALGKRSRKAVREQLEAFFGELESGAFLAKLPTAQG
jgi:hypothetical protein